MYLIFTFREFKSIHKGKTAILHLRFGTEKNRRLGSKKARYNRAFRRRHLFCLRIMVGVRGFEPPASWSRTKHSTKLSHTPINIHFPRRNHPTRRILYRNIADLSISERKKLSADGKNFFILPSLLKIHSLL